MTASRGFAFSCDSTDGCLAHAMVQGESLVAARDALASALDWFTSPDGDLCPFHAEKRSAIAASWQP